MARPTWVQAAAVAEFQELIAGLDAIAAANSLDAAAIANFSMPVASAAAVSATSPAATIPVHGWQAAAQALYAAIPELVSGLTGIDPSLPAGCFALASGLVAAIDPAAAAAAFAYAFDSTPIPAFAAANPTPNRLAAQGNAILVARFARMVTLTGYVQALVNQTFTDRPQAVTARADCVGRFDQELSLCSGASDIDAASALVAMRDATVAWLTGAIIDSAPVLKVEAEPLPALVCAWALYQDPARAAELIARNAVAVAEFMPRRFEALSR